MSTIKPLIPIISFVLLVIIVFGWHLLPAPDQLISHGDIHRSHYFFYSYFRWALAQGSIPWWNPYTFSGSPFLANPSVNPLYPINWLLLLLPLNSGFSFHMAFHVFWAMLGMYMLLKRFVSSFASWFGAVAFGLSGIFSAHLYEGNYDVNAACSWLPWTFLAFSLALKNPTKKQIVFAAVTLAFHILAGYQTMTFFALLAVGCYTLISAFTKLSFRPVLVTCMGVLIGVGLVGVQLIPMQQFITETIRTYPKPYAWISYGSLPIHSLALFVDPFRYGDQYSYNEGYIGYWEHAVFLGRVTLLFAVYSLFIFVLQIIRKRKQASLPTEHRVTLITALVLGVFGIWVSLGPNAPIDLQYLLWRYVPLYNYIRIPPRHLLLVVFGLCLLASIGIHILTAKQTKKKFLLQGLLAGILLYELIPFAKHFVVSQEIPQKRHDSYLTNLFTTTTSRLLPNFVVWHPPRRSLEFDSPLLYRYFSASGYDVVIPKKYYQFFNAISNRDDVFDASMQVVVFDVYPQALSFLNIGHVLLSYDNNQFENTPGFSLVKEDQSQWYKLYANTAVYPRFSLVPTATQLATEENVYAAIRNKSFDYTKTFMTTDKHIPLPSTNPCDLAQTEIKTRVYTPNSITLAVDNPCDGYLVSSENSFPGWKAIVDTQETPIITANLAFRAIFLPKGNHTVTFYYEPTIFLVGLCVSLGTIIGIGIVLTRKTHAHSR